MKGEPLKGKIKNHWSDSQGYNLYEQDDIKSAVEFREKEFRHRIAKRTLEGINGEDNPITIQDICDISREVDKKAFEDVMKE